jgi:hypothetical protein
MKTLLSLAIPALLTGCTLHADDYGVPGPPHVTKPAVEGTVFTIVFENHGRSEVLRPEYSTFYTLSQQYGSAEAYISGLHPSLLNYIELTSGSPHRIAASDPPSKQAQLVEGSEHLADQLDAAGIKWRAYMESMHEPCRMESAYPYVVNHNPFMYYPSFTGDVERCKDRVVDFHEHFSADLAGGQYRYMWITPDQCSNMHDCDPAVADAWLRDVVDEITASRAYQNNGAIFILFDEGSLRILGAEANLATIVMSPQLVSNGFATRTRFGHPSYLATIQDIFGLPRLPTTACATPMNEFFVLKDGQPTSACSAPQVQP